MKAGPLLETVLYADDLSAAQRFYGEVLGLELQRAVEGRFAFFRCAEQMLLIFNPAITATQSLSDGPPPHGAKGAGHVCFRADLAQRPRGKPTSWLMAWQSKRKCSGRTAATHSISATPPETPLNSPKQNSGPDMTAKSLKGETLLIATHNKGKLEEFRQIFAPLGVAVTSAGERGLGEPAETEDSFIGNARIKAKAAMDASGLVTIADDLGLCVDALDGAPGVYTADWAGPTRDWSMAMRTVEEKLQAKGATTPARRGAHLQLHPCGAVARWQRTHLRGTGTGPSRPGRPGVPWAMAMIRCSCPMAATARPSPNFRQTRKMPYRTGRGRWRFCMKDLL